MMQIHEKKKKKSEPNNNKCSIYLRSARARETLRICIENNINFFPSSSQLIFEYRRDQIGFAELLEDDRII